MSQNNFACPCCGYKTLEEEPNGTYNLCPVCYWEDDQIQFSDHDYTGGANRVSLKQAQKNFREFGACEEDFIKSVRTPTKDEARDTSWTWLE
jgi:hypothetical protein